MPALPVDPSVYLNTPGQFANSGGVPGGMPGLGSGTGTPIAPMPGGTFDPYAIGGGGSPGGGNNVSGLPSGFSTTALPIDPRTMLYGSGGATIGQGQAVATSDPGPPPGAPGYKGPAMPGAPGAGGNSTTGDPNQTSGANDPNAGGMGMGYYPSGMSQEDYNQAIFDSQVAAGQGAIGGYGSGFNVTPLSAYGYGYPAGGGGAGGFSPLAAGMNAIGNVAAAQAGAQGNIGAAQAGAQGQIGAASQAAQASELASKLGLQGLQGTNAANQAIAQTQAGAQIGTAGLGAQAQEFTASQQAQASELASQLQLQGVDAQAAAEIAKAQVAAQAQEQVAQTQNVPALAKLSLLQGLIGQPGGIMSAIFGSGGLGGALGGVGLGGGSSSGSGSGGAGAGGQPAVPTFQPMNAQQMQANINAGQAGIDQQIASLSNQLLNKQGTSGGSALGGAGGGGIDQGLPPGLQMQLLQEQLGQGTANNLNWENTSLAQNNQNALAYGQLGLGQFNQNRNFNLNALLGIGNLGMQGLGLFN